MRDPRYDILMEPVKIGPVVAKNRFYQVPHCCGMGSRYAKTQAAMRGMKAEGGWAVVSTEEAEIHPSSEVAPYNENRIWDQRDVDRLQHWTGSVKEHGALAAIELCHSGINAPNNFTREISLGPSHRPIIGGMGQARAMSKQDIADVRRWFKQSALRSRDAGFDIVYVYAGHDLTLLQHFLCARHNDRTDEYGGSLENRLRLFKEVLIETKEAVGDRCAIAVRFAVDELMGEDGLTSQGEGYDVVAMLAELPDLWDVNISDWDNDSQVSRFSQEGYQEDYIKFVKDLTTKPVVGVGRYTSPDSMVRVVKQGIMDMIGAARPSIADPFLPKKIEEGRIDDVRECIGCNICVAGDHLMVPMRCTQNPTMGEEWRKGWHPEKIAPAKTKDKVLIIGGGPAGLEAARACGARGLDVTLAEASNEWGGRVSREARLPGLNEWARVRDWRMGQIQKMGNVNAYLESRLSAEDVMSYGIENVVVATGCYWRRDAIGKNVLKPIPGLESGLVLSPDDLMTNSQALSGAPEGPVVIFDDDHYYMGSLMAELAIASGRETHFVTPSSMVASWTENTLEQHRIQTRLMELGVKLHLSHSLTSRLEGQLTVACGYTGNTKTLDCAALISVTARLPNDQLYQDLMSRKTDWADAGITSLERIGDCNAPNIIAHAVYAGHRYAQEFGEVIDRDYPIFRRED